jgi:hypothetical protein
MSINTSKLVIRSQEAQFTYGTQILLDGGVCHKRELTVCGRLSTHPRMARAGVDSIYCILLLLYVVIYIYLLSLSMASMSNMTL